MKNKKTKLTISGNAKKSIGNIELAKTQNKNSVVIEKKTSRFGNRSSFSKSTTQNTVSKKRGYVNENPTNFLKPTFSMLFLINSYFLLTSSLASLLNKISDRRYEF